jgi:hypothetical protein
MGSLCCVVFVAVEAKVAMSVSLTVNLPTTNGSASTADEVRNLVANDNATTTAFKEQFLSSLAATGVNTTGVVVNIVNITVTQVFVPDERRVLVGGHYIYVITFDVEVTKLSSAAVAQVIS